MHRPELWGYVQFSTAPPGKADFRPDPAGPARYLLQRIYEAQRKYHLWHKRYAPTFAELGLTALSHKSLTGPPQIEIRADGFLATVEVLLPDGNRKRCSIRQDSLIQ